MTAYGRSQVTTQLGRFLIEIHSVNRRNLDLNISLPKEIIYMDIDYRRWLSKRIKRGGINVRVTKEIDKQNFEYILPDLESLKSLKNEWFKAAKALNFDPENQITLSFLLDQIDRLPLKANEIETSKLQENIMQGLEEAFEAFLEMKKKEGFELQKDIQARIFTIKNSVKEIEGNTQQPIEDYKERLMTKIREIKEITPDDKERVAREIVLFAEKIDISEEITRLHSHILQFEDLLANADISKGKSLDFILQEMNREANTINSKASNLEIAKLAINMKSEIEKIREQIQNVE